MIVARALVFSLAAAASGQSGAMPELEEAKRAFERGQYALAQKKLMFPAEVGDAEAQELRD